MSSLIDGLSKYGVLSEDDKTAIQTAHAQSQQDMFNRAFQVIEIIANLDTRWVDPRNERAYTLANAMVAAYWNAIRGGGER